MKSYDKQSKLLDLLEIFREYTEKSRLQSASIIIASQVAHLETAIQQIETKTKALARPSPPTTASASTATTSPNYSFVSIASNGAKAITSP